MSIFPSRLAKEFSGWPKLWLDQSFTTKKLKAGGFSFEGLPGQNAESYKKKYQQWGMHGQGEEKQRSWERRTALRSESVMWVPELCSPAGAQPCFKSNPAQHDMSRLQCLFIWSFLETWPRGERGSEADNSFKIHFLFFFCFGEVSCFPPMLTGQG